MDVIIIGKKVFAHSAPPVVIYCGQSNVEANAAIAATEGVYPYIYAVDPQPFRRLNAPVPPAAKTEQPAAPPAPAPESPAATPHKKSKKSHE